jgi:formylglycine-generating enzyme required for sulfatase activity
MTLKILGFQAHGGITMKRLDASVLILAWFIGAAWSAPGAVGQPPLAIAPLSADQVQDIQQRWATHIGKDLVHTNSIGMKLVLLPPGEFTMGRTEEQFDEYLRFIEKHPELKRNRGGLITWSMLLMPPRRVRITKPFYMGATEVTVGQFRQFCEASGYKTEAEQGLDGGVPYKEKRPLPTWRRPMPWLKDYKQKDDEPVLHLCWNDCVAFCKWLSEKEGVEYCLPTEAEWEYACRAGTTTPWHFGGFDDLDRVAHEYAYWSEGKQGKHDRPRSVAQGKPNAFGVYDMHGNVWEYVADWWHEFDHKDWPLNDPTGPAEQHERGDLRRIIRGSSYDWDSWGGDSAYRMRITQRSSQHPHQGFRVAMRIKGVKGVAPAVYPDQEQRSKSRDPGRDSKEVLAALKAGESGKNYPKELRIDLGAEARMEFVLIPAGTFLMGSAKGARDETPVHRVVISRPFYMARFPLTQGQWKAVMGDDKGLAKLWEGNPDTVGPDKVMVGLSWNDCRQFIAQLGKKVPGHRFSLPTEAQWEYACRAGSTSEFYFGDNPSKLDDYAWHEGNMVWPGKHGNDKRYAYPTVGQKKPNAWGLYDMHGGVWEWCQDWYDADYYLRSPLVDPPGPDKGRFRVVRGGSWFRYGKYARSAYRRFFHPEADGDYVTPYIMDFGCRIVINLPESTLPSPPGRGAGGEGAALALAENLVKYKGNPVLDLGKPGAWDDLGLGCFCVSRVADQFMLWYAGAGKGAKDWRLGLAISPDGLAWKRSAHNPVLRQANMPSVLKDGDTFYMLYSAGGGFALATSPDGRNWKPYDKNPVLRGTGASLDPCLRKFGDRFHLWYCGNLEGKYRLFHATSRDCIQWENEPPPILPLGQPGEFDSNGHAGPIVLKVEDTWFLFYLGSDKKRARWSAGVATSTDGKNWKKSSANPVLDIGGPDDWDGGSLMHLDVHWGNGRFHLWYAAHAAAAKDKSEAEAGIRIGYATSRLP